MNDLKTCHRCNRISIECLEDYDDSPDLVCFGSTDPKCITPNKGGLTKKTVDHKCVVCRKPVTLLWLTSKDIDIPETASTATLGTWIGVMLGENDTRLVVYCSEECVRILWSESNAS